MRSTVKSGRKTTASKTGAKSKSPVRGKSAATSRSAKNPPRNKKASSKKAAPVRATAKKTAPKKSEPQSHEETLKNIFHEILKDTLNAEKQLVKALPKMAKASTSPKLGKAFEKHLAETEKQVTRLEKVFQICDLKVAGKKCEAMEGLVKEGEEAIKETPKGSWVRDVALIVAAQKVEHYEIAAYGSLRSIASILGYEKAADLLQKTLDEETGADEKLTAISETVNPAAKGSSSSKEKSASESKSSSSGKNSKKDPEMNERSSKNEKPVGVKASMKNDEEEEGDEYDDSDDSDLDHEDEEYDDETEEKEDTRSGSLGNSL